MSRGCSIPNIDVEYVRNFGKTRKTGRERAF